MQTGSALRRVEVDWVADKELKVSNHNEHIYIYTVNNRVSPVW